MRPRLETITTGTVQRIFSGQRNPPVSQRKTLENHQGTRVDPKDNGINESRGTNGTPNETK